MQYTCGEGSCRPTERDVKLKDVHVPVLYWGNDMGPRTTTTAEGDANNCASGRRRPCVHRANPRANLAHRLRVHRCHLFDHLSIPPPLASPLHTHQEHPTSFAFVSVSRGDHHRWRYTERTDVCDHSISTINKTIVGRS